MGCSASTNISKPAGHQQQLHLGGLNSAAQKSSVGEDGTSPVDSSPTSTVPNSNNNSHSVIDDLDQLRSKENSKGAAAFDEDSRGSLGAVSSSAAGQTTADSMSPRGGSLHTADTGRSRRRFRSIVDSGEVFSVSSDKSDCDPLGQKRSSRKQSPGSPTGLSAGSPTELHTTSSSLSAFRARHGTRQREGSVGDSSSESPTEYEGSPLLTLQQQAGKPITTSLVAALPSGDYSDDEHETADAESPFGRHISNVSTSSSHSAGTPRPFPTPMVGGFNYPLPIPEHSAADVPSPRRHNPVDDPPQVMVSAIPEIVAAASSSSSHASEGHVQSNRSNSITQSNTPTPTPHPVSSLPQDPTKMMSPTVSGVGFGRNSRRSSAVSSNGSFCQLGPKKVSFVELDALESCSHSDAKATPNKQRSPCTPPLHHPAAVDGDLTHGI